LKDIESIVSELEQQRSAIDRAISALREVSGTQASETSDGSQQQQAPATKKRGITPAGRRKLAEAMRRRWAAKRAGEQNSIAGTQKSAPAAKKTRATKKRRLSPEGRQRIIEATKRRWAAQRTTL
jgi:hypothetical protein